MLGGHHGYDEHMFDGSISLQDSLNKSEKPRWLFNWVIVTPLEPTAVSSRMYRLSARYKDKEMTRVCIGSVVIKGEPINI